jgi:parallel beta-helix repeat protein
MTGNGGNGIFLNRSSNNTVSHNKISNNEYPGVAVGYSSNTNDIYDNIISNNTQAGIMIAISSNNNKISRNLLSNNDDNGILIYDSSKYNVIKNNNIISNKYTSFFRYSYPNFWFGNYWDDWNKKTPRPIYGELRLERFGKRIIPWIQFDWKPATEPYDIER